MKKVFFCLLMCMLFSCNNSQDRKFISLLQTEFKSPEIRDNWFVLVNSRGCLECEKHAFEYIICHITSLTRFQIIISSEFLKSIHFDKLVPKPIYIDEKNLLELTSLPVNGVSIIKFEKGRIKVIKSIDPVFLQNHSVQDFFCDN